MNMRSLAAKLLLVFFVWALPLVVAQWPGAAGGDFAAGLSHFAASGQAQAQADGQKRKKRRTRRTPAVKATTYKVLEEAQIMIDPESVPREEGERAPKATGTPAEAVDFLMDELDSQKLNDYERALIWNTLAFAYYTLEDIAGAIDAYHEVLEQESITDVLEKQTLRAIFQLYYGEEDYEAAFDYMDRWEEINGMEDPDVTYLRAAAYYQLEDQAAALEAAERVLELAVEQERATKENWLYLLVVLYNEREETDKMLELLEELAVRFSKKRYWVHLAGLYSEKDEQDRALGAYYAAYVQNFLDKESELLALASRLISAENPHEGSRILEQGFADEIVEENERNLSLLGTAYTMARETAEALEAWERATEYAEDGEIFYRLGQALSGEDRHEEAIEAYRSALEEGDLRSESDVHFWLGISLLQLEEWDDATRAFRKASDLDEENADQSFRYVQYIAKERKRQADLAKSLVEAAKPRVFRLQ